MTFAVAVATANAIVGELGVWQFALQAASGVVIGIGVSHVAGSQSTTGRALTVLVGSAVISAVLTVALMIGVTALPFQVPEPILGFSIGLGFALIFTAGWCAMGCLRVISQMLA